MSLSALLDWSLRGTHFVSVTDSSWPISATWLPPTGFSAATYTPDPYLTITNGSFSEGNSTNR